MSTKTIYSAFLILQAYVCNRVDTYICSLSSCKQKINSKNSRTLNSTHYKNGFHNFGLLVNFVYTSRGHCIS